MVPAVAARAVEYAAFWVAFGKVVVVIVGGTSTVMLSACVAVSPFISWACTVKMLVPAPVGVPEITPVLALRASPTGRLPTVVDQV